MPYTAPEKLNTKALALLLEKLYTAVPALLPLIAPEGWKNSRYHHMMMYERQEQYQNYIQSMADMGTKQYRPHSRYIAPNPDPEEEIDFDSYFGITFPPLYDDHIEVFYTLVDLLVELTSCSFLIRNGAEPQYYVDEDGTEALLYEIAYRHGHIDQYTYDTMATICSAPVLDNLNQIQGLECIFAVIRSEGYALKHWDDELLYIRELQEGYDDLSYAPIPAQEKEMTQQDIRKRIQNCLAEYTQSPVDPFDFRSIVALFNRRKICPIILAYLHAYDEFPIGYPYTYRHYNEGNEWI
ncbi:hypothetical protein FAZ19_23620 [Sphingobacterium alkalisoli]|uniref:Uncharacterized protein n=1 Tax=Sphingobacterium alkalisoli TaxID=1874115 RepID=A0A4U0GM03_9SPHI|nr:hypothetical protein [Sphingobacterium alkalisoli]TJY59697.1 hypothetical protein FAZ19_23620 [Sphingobacterium alkalisoli]GGH33090.1 hypothetical protein GCM10011418_47060 [Sphingobacterium alkalisoli]